MSTPNSARRSASPGTPFRGLPLWSALTILVAALITGLLLSLATGGLGLAFLGCFAVAAIVVTLLVEPRGVFLTVACMPFFFGVATVFTSWFIGRAQASEGAPLLSRASIVTAIYPLTQHFPWMAIVTAIAIAIGVIRLWLLHRHSARQERAAALQRRRTFEADRRNRALSSRARRRSEQITVEELLARNRARSDSSATRRPRRERPSE